MHWRICALASAAVFVYLCNVYRTPCTFSRSNISTEIHQPCLPFSVQLIIWNESVRTYHRLANTAPLTAAELLNLEITTIFSMITPAPGWVAQYSCTLIFMLKNAGCLWMISAADTQQISASKSHQGWKYFLLTHTCLLLFHFLSLPCNIFFII